MLRRTHGGQPRKIEAIRSYLAQFGHRPGQRIVRDVAGKIASERVASHRDWLRPNARCGGSAMAMPIRPTVCVVSAESAGRIRRACLSRAVETEDRRKVRCWTLQISIQVIQDVFLASRFGKVIGKVIGRAVAAWSCPLRVGPSPYPIHQACPKGIQARRLPPSKGCRTGRSNAPAYFSGFDAQPAYHLVNWCRRAL